ncbi:MAG: hypothetical protein JSS72_09375 [Armatimonadetes bacterium]|nr:hypothetical protein [Armatimonadota bacterium]
MAKVITFAKKNTKFLRAAAITVIAFTFFQVSLNSELHYKELSQMDFAVAEYWTLYGKWPDSLKELKRYEAEHNKALTSVLWGHTTFKALADGGLDVSFHSSWGPWAPRGHRTYYIDETGRRVKRLQDGHPR